MRADVYGALVFLLGACNQAFGLDGTTTGTADALPDNCSVAVYGLLADTYLRDDRPRGDHDEVLGIAGDADVASDVEPALFSFKIGTLAATDRVAAAVLNVSPVAEAAECAASGVACTSCGTGASRYMAYWNRRDWSPSDATRTVRRSQNTWEQPFARGATDRSALVASGPIEAPRGGIVALPIRIDDVARVDPAPWIEYSNSEASHVLSIQLVTDAAFAVASDDYDHTPCPMQGLPAATLVLTICRT